MKAGHCVEPVRGIQLCAAAAGINNARAVRKAVEASGAISFALAVPPRDLNINEGFQNAQWCSKVRKAPTAPSTLLATRGRLISGVGTLILELHVTEKLSVSLIPANVALLF